MANGISGNQPRGNRIQRLSGNSPVLGHQLERRVKAGAISQGQAEKTARQRQTFKAAFGSDWRSKVFGEDMQGLRTGAAQGKPRFQGANAALQTRRSQMLAAARKKLTSPNTSQRRYY